MFCDCPVNGFCLAVHNSTFGSMSGPSAQLALSCLHSSLAPDNADMLQVCALGA
jgi:hypothetical protein